MCARVQRSPLVKSSTSHDTRLYFRIYRTQRIFVPLLWLQLSITVDLCTLADSFLLQYGGNEFPFWRLWHCRCDKFKYIHEEIASQLNPSCLIHERNTPSSIASWTNHSGNCFRIPLNSKYTSVHECPLPNAHAHAQGSCAADKKQI